MEKYCTSWFSRTLLCTFAHVSRHSRGVGMGPPGGSGPQLPLSHLLDEDVLGAHGVDAYVAVDELRDVDVDGHAGQHVGVIAAQMLLPPREN